MILFNNTKYLFPTTTIFRLLFPFSSSKLTQQASLDLIMQRLKINVTKSQQLQKALISASLGQSKAHINQDKARIQINNMAPLVSLYEQISSALKNIQDLNQMHKQTQDIQERNIINHEIQQLEKRKEELKQDSLKELIEPDMYDDVKEVVLQFRAGAGGSESSLFVEQFSNMIIGYCDGMNWKVQTLSSARDSSINRGFRTLNLKVQGDEVYKILKCQSGVHKVIRVPQTETKGRLHSSTISMVAMPSVPFDFNLSEKDIRYEYMRASGPGGQSVNKTESACRATHIPTGLSVMNQQDRSQDRNRKRATEILKQKLFEIEYKKNVEEESKTRKSQLGTMDRSQKIRTYNFPQDRITDHRTGLTLFGIENMMAGQLLDKFISSYQEKIHEEKLELLLEDLKAKPNMM